MDEIKLRKTDHLTPTELGRAGASLDKSNFKKSANANTAESGSADTVDVTTSQYIQQALDPTKLAAERRDKIEKLKKLIDSGEYSPSTDAVAAAVGQDIAFEILQPQTKFSED